jgi:hypothetical protein
MCEQTGCRVFATARQPIGENFFEKSGRAHDAGQQR